MLKRWALGVAAAMAIGASGAAHAEWREVETAHFRIYSEGSEKSVVQYAERLEAVHYLMKIATGMKDDRTVNKVNVYYVDSPDHLRRLLGLGSNSSVAGIYIPSIRGSSAMVPRGGDGSLSSQAVLFHEYGHHFMLQYQPAAYPAWYVEGWAELVSTASFERKGAITFGKPAEHRRVELDYAPWIPLRKLMVRRDGKNSKVEGSYYGQSWLLAHYLILSDKRPGQLRAYLLAILSGKSDEEAWQAFGSIDELERDARAYLRARSFPYKAPELPATVMAIQSSRLLRPGEAAVMEERLQLLRRRDDDTRAAILARLEADAARFPDDAAVQLLLAEQYGDAEQWDKSAAAAGRAIALDAGLARAHLARGLALSQGEADEPDAAHAALAKALELAPADPAILYGQYSVAVRIDGHAGDDTVDRLIRASDLAPQNNDVRIAAATALIARSDMVGALKRLLPLASGPHPSQAQKRARQLVDWITAGGTGTPPAPETEEEAGEDADKDGKGEI